MLRGSPRGWDLLLDYTTTVEGVEVGPMEVRLPLGSLDAALKAARAHSKCKTCAPLRIEGPDGEVIIASGGALDLGPLGPSYLTVSLVRDPLPGYEFKIVKETNG